MTINANFPYLLSVKGELKSIARPQIMGIINLTPDSFFEGSRAQSIQQAVNQAGQMLESGADLLDIGAVSTRPGTIMPSKDEEFERLLPALEAILTAYPDAWVSVDTWRGAVAKVAVGIGAGMINDVSGGEWDIEEDDAMWQVLPSLGVPYVLMHSQGEPDVMQKNPNYTDVVAEVVEHLARKAHALFAIGVHDVIIDPGFGFGKTVAHNYSLLNSLSVLHSLEKPILVGASRKGMAWKVLKNGTPDNALHASTAIHMVALMKGAAFIRTHDVEAAVQTRAVWEALEKAKE